MAKIVYENRQKWKNRTRAAPALRQHTCRQPRIVGGDHGGKKKDDEEEQQISCVYETNPPSSVGQSRT